MNNNPELEGREAFLAPIKYNFLKAELEHIETAYVFSKYAHSEQKRKSGEPYFEHPRAVAEIIFKELKIYCWETIVTGLLHDVTEDTNLLTEHRIFINFGRNVALWVKLVTKEDKENYFERLMGCGLWQPLVVKLADRLHNLRTLESFDLERRKRQIEETEKFVLPLGNLAIDLTPPEYKKSVSSAKDDIIRLCVKYAD